MTFQDTSTISGLKVNSHFCLVPTHTIYEQLKRKENFSLFIPLKEKKGILLILM